MFSSSKNKVDFLDGNTICNRCCLPASLAGEVSSELVANETGVLAVSHLLALRLPVSLVQHSSQRSGVRHRRSVGECLERVNVRAHCARLAEERRRLVRQTDRRLSVLHLLLYWFIISL